ncbi:hypothetical protein ES332_A11G073800v1 [Gossypium tomentosum]|uniref:Uncharacterized protein n=1 Tax=Gossypium tomentosum TaxID=34277 RepID=A0A5D2N7Y2_GOSTO|nr:hypothetical protein ES332_A11G073800v1 [Gossypium tomentosum]
MKLKNSEDDFIICGWRQGGYESPIISNSRVSSLKAEESSSYSLSSSTATMSKIFCKQS